MGKRQKEMEKKHHIQVLYILQGTGLTIVLTCVFVLIAAWMVGNGILSDQVSDWAIRTICFISSFFTSMFQHKRLGKYTAAEGMLSALVAGTLFAGVGMIIWGKLSVEKVIWNILLFVFGGGLFGILTGNKKKKRRN